MPGSRRAIVAAGPVILLGGLLGCGGDAGPTDPVQASVAECGLAAPLDVGVPSLLPPDADCLALGTAPGKFALAFFDSRSLTESRLTPGTVQAGASDPTFGVSVQAGGRGAASRGRRPAAVERPTAPARDPDVVPFRDAVAWPAADPEAPRGDGSDPIRFGAAGAREACGRFEGFDVFCRQTPWSVGDTLTVPAQLRGFIDERAALRKVVYVRGPFAFTGAPGIGAAQALALRPYLDRLADVGTRRIVPLLRHSLLDRPVYTADGARQILVDVVFDEQAVCICGVAVGHTVEGRGVAGIGIRIPLGDEFEAGRIGLFAHELTHVWQLAHEVDRSADPSLPPPTASWALEGGADLVKQEILRGLAAEPLAPNLDADAAPGDPFTQRWLRNLRAATGDIRAGYGETAGLLRYLYVQTAVVHGRFDRALPAVLRGSLEGWYPSPDPVFPGPGLGERLGAIVEGFDPVEAILAYALANAVDDRTANKRLQNHAVREAWRESAGSRFVPAATIRGHEGFTDVRLNAGAVGYVVIDHPGAFVRQHERLDFGSDAEGVRWMVTRFE